MNDVVEVVRDYVEEMREYIMRALLKKKIRSRHLSHCKSHRRNWWYSVLSPEE